MRLRNEMKALEVAWHFNTPGHPKSKGGIERLHSTLGDHLRVFHVDKGLDADAAMPKAVAAYNHSIHMATGFSPFEILFGLRERRRDRGTTMVDEGVAADLVNNRIALTKLRRTAHRKMAEEKRRQVARDNLRICDRMGDIRIGSVVYRRFGSNRSKEVVRYEGPFRVIVIREHNIVTIESINEPKKRRTMHVEQLKIPMGELRQP